ncbi:MAG: hypothetical protein DMF56_19305 [Acidobacteria bacterium]|nr:MAG: hypothetical protein DMF56_19305 [Acidobacteriota bacterium]
MTNFSFEFGRRTCTLFTLLLVLSMACGKEKPAAPSSNRPPAARPAAPRETTAWLTGYDQWRPCRSTLGPGEVLEEGDCGPNVIPDQLVRNLRTDPVSISSSECNQLMETEREAVQLLAHVPGCVDAVVAKLAGFAATRNDAAVMSDLSAAYYTRAQRKHQPWDLVRALDAAEQAATLAPGLIPARFNRALAEEALGFFDQSIASWDALSRTAGPGWARDAAAHYSRLRSEQAIQWDEERLVRAAQSGNSRTMEDLVSPYRATVQRYVGETVLPEWAQASEGGRSKEAAERLLLAHAIASALARLTKDRYLLEIVDAVRTCDDPERLRQLRLGHLAFAEARDVEMRLNGKAAERPYWKAEQILTEAGSPLRFSAAVGHVTALTQAKKTGEAVAELRRVEDAVRGRYPSVLARVHRARGYLYVVQGRYFDALAEYDRAQRVVESIGDTEELSEITSKKIGVLRTIGERDLTWTEIVRTWRHPSAILRPAARHYFLGECALSAVDLGYPRVGLQYQELAVRLLEDEIGRSGAGGPLQGLRANLGIALRVRANIRLRLGDRKGAEADLVLAKPLIGNEDAPIPIGYRARLAEVEAQELAGRDRKAAIGKFTEAIRYARETNYNTLLASLLVQRAEQERLEGDRPAALRDLHDAIEQLRKEEKAVLASTAPASQAERLWSSYFSCRQEAYRQLIRQLIETGGEKEAEEAFAYAEKARGSEPLHRLLQRDDLPPEFRQEIRNGEPFGLDDIAGVLPDGTFLLQYCVLDDRTYVWIVWHGDHERRTLQVGNAAIARWSADLLQAGEEHAEAFEAGLAAPYQALLAEPIARIAKLHGKNTIPRVVIVPDRAMHGLPFSALRNGNRYVVRDYVISVAASGTLYAFSLAQDRQLSLSEPESVLLVSDPAFDENLHVAHGLKRLQTARYERERIEQLYRSVIDVRPPLEGAAATVPAFVSLAADSTIVHVIAHGVANPDVPSNSFLLLAPAENDSGLLNVEKLLRQLRLKKTRLVVLSACSSAGGTAVGPEGLAPLVRPIITAGAPGVVGTLWKVWDARVTADFLVFFHQHYREGHDADEALRLAQLDMLDGDIAHQSAAAWAPFQAIGYASSPFRPSQ